MILPQAILKFMVHGARVAKSRMPALLVYMKECQGETFILKLGEQDYKWNY